MNPKMLFFCLCLLPLLTSGQEGQRHSLDAGFGVYVSHRLISAPDQRIRTSFNNDYGSGILVSGGVHYNYRFSSHCALRAGIRISGYGLRSVPRSEPGVPQGTGLQYDPTLPIAHPGGIQTEFKSRSADWYLGIPLLMRISFPASGFQYFIEFGFNPSYYVKSYSRVTANGMFRQDNGHIDYPGLHDFRLFTLVAIGGEFSLSQKIQCFVQPTFSLQLNGSSNSIVTTRPYGIGLEAGVRKSLNLRSSDK